MTTVEIDIELIGTAITALEDLAGDIDAQRSVATSSCPISLPALAESTLGKTSRWLTDHLEDLTTRRDLAILLDKEGTGAATYTVANDTASNVKQLLGEALADRADELHPAFPDQYRAYTAMLATWAEDPTVMAAMYGDLDAEGTLRVMTAAAGDPAGYGLEHGEQQALLDLFRTGLESASNDAAFRNSGFAGRLVDEATRDYDDYFGAGAYNPSGALAFLLTDGQYHPSFLKTIAEDLDHYERVEMNGARGIWGTRPNDGADFSQFVDWGSAYDNLDPMTGLMSAMENDPALALEFFSDNDDPDQPGEGVNSRAYYYLRERGWNQDGYDAITGVIDAATTDPGVTADPESPQAQDAARLVSKFVDYMSERPNFNEIVERSSWPGNEASENVAHMLTTYMAGVDHALTPGADGDVDAGVFRYTSDADRGVIPNMPLFDRESLEKLTLWGLSSDDGFAQMRDGLNEYRADKLGSIADQLAADPDSGQVQNGLTTALGADARLEGFMVKTLQDEHIGDAEERDAKTKAWIEFGSDVVDIIPVPGVDKITEEVAKNVVNGAIDRGKSTGTDAITDWLANEAEGATATANDVADGTLSQHSYIVATMLAERGLAGDPNLEVPSWDEYSAMSDSEQATVRSELFSRTSGIGGHFNIDDYAQAFDAEFRDYFE